MSTPLTVVVATHKRPDLLKRTLGSLSECVVPDSFQGTIIIENGGKFGAEQVLSPTKSVLKTRYLFQSEACKSKALNTALQYVSDGLVVFIDDDVRVSIKLLTAYADAADRYGRGHFFGGPVSVDYEQRPPDWLVPYLPKSAAGWELDESDNPINGPVFLGGNWAVWRDDIDCCNGFSLSLGPEHDRAVGEDSELQRDLLNLGALGIYVPDARLWHYVPASRCNPTWTLRRRYRTSISRGLQMTDDSTRFLGWPRWMIRELITQCTKAILLQPFSNARQQFDRWYEYWTLRGHLKGCRIAYLKNWKQGAIQK